MVGVMEYWSLTRTITIKKSTHQKAGNHQVRRLLPKRKHIKRESEEARVQMGAGSLA